MTYPEPRGIIDKCTNIDNLRNPIDEALPDQFGTGRNQGMGIVGKTCRGKPIGRSTVIHLQQGQEFTIGMDITAHHIGQCSAYILEKNLNSSTAVLVGKGKNCAVSTSGEWTFTVMNTNAITCTECVLRWEWDAIHISSTWNDTIPHGLEHFENCADVILGVGPGNNSPQYALKPLETCLVSNVETKSVPIGLILGIVAVVLGIVLFVFQRYRAKKQTAVNTKKRIEFNTFTAPSLPPRPVPPRPKNYNLYRQSL
jgi:hypothetical protein